MNLRYVASRAKSVIRPSPRTEPLDADAIARSAEALGIVERFNDLYYTGAVNGDLNWKGVPVSKNPCDLWMMVELIQRIRPSLLIETGTNFGGSALFFADIAKTLSIPMGVLTIDYNPKWKIDPSKSGITSLVGLSTDPRILERAREVVARANGHILVVLDSDHSEPNVSEELRLYSPFVTKGSYIVVEDTNINGHPSAPNHGPGPFEAVEKFLATSSGFVRDPECERFLLTFNPKGWLKRV